MRLSTIRPRAHQFWRERSRRVFRLPRGESGGRNSSKPGPAAPHAKGSWMASPFAPAFLQERDDGGGGFFDRAAAHVDARPAMLGTQALGCRDLLGDGLAIDVGRIGLLGIQREQTVLPDLH